MKAKKPAAMLRTCTCGCKYFTYDNDKRTYRCIVCKRLGQTP